MQAHEDDESRGILQRRVLPWSKSVACHWTLRAALGPVLLLTLTACGSPPPAETPSDMGDAPAESAEAPAENPAPAAQSKDAAPSKNAESDEAAQLAKAEQEQQSAVPAMREILYTVTPEGLMVDVEGARFKPRAKVTKLPGGGFGIDLEVEAEARDDRTHTLSSPSLGPLAIAARIRDKSDKEIAQYSDRRIGEGQELLLPGNPLVLKRSWPSGEVKGPLWWGQKVHIDVGLWGFGTDAEQGRPLKKLFVVDLVAGAKAQALISPPDIKQ